MTEPWPFLLLALAAYRLFRLLAYDAILDRVRDAASLREGFWTCPWCLGFWIALAWWGAWLLWPHATLIAATPLALSAVLALVFRVWDGGE